MSPARTWALFKLIRVLVYSLSTILSVGWAAIYAVLLIRGWNSYNGDQRAIVIVLLAIYAISAIMLYLMIIVRFRLWLDGVRIALLLLFQVGGTVTFALFNPTLPCDNVGSESTCKEFESVAIYGGWSLSALLLIYAFVLAIMSSIPAPSPRPNPEAALAINLGSEFPAEKKKRDSFSSVGSSYSQSSFIARPYPYTTYRSDGPDARSPTVSNHSQMTHNYYRPGTPGSTYSTAPSSISSIRNSTRQKYNYSNRMPAPVPRVPPTFNQMQLPQMSIPQQAPGEVVQRQGTLMSIDSRRPIRNDGSLYDPRNARLLTPPGLGYNGPVQIVSQPPVSGSTHLAVPRGMSPQANQFSPSRMGTPVTLAWHGPQGHQYPTRSLSPGSDSLHSLGGARLPSRNGSFSSVPRSPSPQNMSFHNLPSTPMSAMLPAHPGLPAATYYGGEGEGVHELRRYGSAPNMNVNSRPVGAIYLHHSGSDYHETAPSHLGRNGEQIDIRQWRQNLVREVVRGG